MATIKLSLADLGAAMPLQETLEAIGHSVTWDSESASGPNPNTAYAGLIVLDAESERCIAAADAWRDFNPPPGILMLGVSEKAKANAKKARSTIIAGYATPTEFEETIKAILSMRFTDRMSGPYARAKLGLGDSLGPIEDAANIVRGSRNVDIDFIKASLRWCAHDYIYANRYIEELREQRVLSVPEIETLPLLNGTKTIQHLVSAPSGEGIMRGRFLWAMLSSGAAIATSEPADEESPQRKHLANVRRNLVARRLRLAKATHYDVLEVDRDASAEWIDYAARTLAIRYSPDRLKLLDLGAYNKLVDSNWQQILVARAVLMDLVDRANYERKVDAHRNVLVSPWAFDVVDTKVAEEFFHRGQMALVEGESFKAVSGMAGACRNHPGHPDYEVSLCWAQFRAEVARGKDRDSLISEKRQAAEAHLVGHRPWPRALTALALLCAADDDADSARYYLQEALAVDPSLPAAKQLLDRL